MTTYRSAMSLILSGAATITLDQRVRLPRLLSAAEAFEVDRKALRSDARRALKKAQREHAGA